MISNRLIYFLKKEYDSNFLGVGDLDVFARGVVERFRIAA